MKTYSKKSKEDLFLIFLLGALFGLIDSRVFDLAYLIGSGLGFMLITVPLGLVLNLVFSKKESSETKQEEQILDAELTTKADNQEQEKKRKEERPFKRGIYVALFCVIIALLGSL